MSAVYKTCPVILTVLIERTKEDLAMLLKANIAAIQKSVALTTDLNNAANQIAANTQVGYKSLDEVRDKMNDLTMQDAFIAEFKTAEDVYRLRIAAFEKSIKLFLELQKLRKNGALDAELKVAEGELLLADKHVKTILSKGTMFVYQDPDQPEQIVKSPESPVEIPAPMVAESSVPAPMVAESSVPAPMVAESSVPKSVYSPGCPQIIQPLPTRYQLPQKIMPDAESKKVNFDWYIKFRTRDGKHDKMYEFDSPNHKLRLACENGSVHEASIAILDGANDYEYGLAAACYYGQTMRAKHMLSLGAKDVQLGLACGLYRDNQDTINFMLANGAKVTDEIIVYAATLKNDSLKKIVNAKSGIIVSDGVFAQLINNPRSAPGNYDYLLRFYRLV